jgi:hypothetical protein
MSFIYIMQKRSKTRRGAYKGAYKGGYKGGYKYSRSPSKSNLSKTRKTKTKIPKKQR